MTEYVNNSRLWMLCTIILDYILQLSLTTIFIGKKNTKLVEKENRSTSVSVLFRDLKQIKRQKIDLSR